MTVVEMRRRSQRDEELTAVGIGSPVRHREDALFAVFQVRMEFVGELIAGSADALAQRIATLNHEAANHAVEDDAVVIRLLHLPAIARIGPFLRALRQTDEVGYGVRRFRVEQPNPETSFARDEISVDGQPQLLV